MRDCEYSTHQALFTYPNHTLNHPDLVYNDGNILVFSELSLNHTIYENTSQVTQYR